MHQFFKENCKLTYNKRAVRFSETLQHPANKHLISFNSGKKRNIQYRSARKLWQKFCMSEGFFACSDSDWTEDLFYWESPKGKIKPIPNPLFPVDSVVFHGNVLSQASINCSWTSCGISSHLYNDTRLTKLKPAFTCHLEPEESTWCLPIKATGRSHTHNALNPASGEKSG